VLASIVNQLVTDQLRKGGEERNGETNRPGGSMDRQHGDEGSVHGMKVINGCKLKRGFWAEGTRQA